MVKAQADHVSKTTTLRRRLRNTLQTHLHRIGCLSKPRSCNKRPNTRQHKVQYSEDIFTTKHTVARFHKHSMPVGTMPPMNSQENTIKEVWIRGRHPTITTRVKSTGHIRCHPPQERFIPLGIRTKLLQNLVGDTIALHNRHHQPKILATPTKMQSVTTGAAPQTSKGIGDVGRLAHVQ